jgi:hypothetical protein
VSACSPRPGRRALAARATAVRGIANRSPSGAERSGPLPFLRALGLGAVLVPGARRGVRSGRECRVSESRRRRSSRGPGRCRSASCRARPRPVCEPAQPGAPVDAGAPDAVVADLDVEPIVREHGGHCRGGIAGVLQGGAEPMARQHRGMDAVRQDPPADDGSFREWAARGEQVADAELLRRVQLAPTRRGRGGARTPRPNRRAIPAMRPGSLFRAVRWAARPDIPDRVSPAE